MQGIFGFFDFLTAAGIEVDTLDIGRKSGIEQKLGEVIDEVGAPVCADALEFGFLGEFEKDLIPPETNAVRIKEAFGLQPIPSSSVQIVRFSQKGMLGFVADDAEFHTLRHRRAEEVEHTWEGLSIQETRAINAPLHLCPIRFPSSLPKMVANSGFVLWKVGGDETSFKATRWKIPS